MSCVTERINNIKQPRGGYIKPSEFEVIDMNDGIVLNEEENVYGSIIGLVVDYLTRFNMGASVIEAFGISMYGAAIAESLGVKKSLKIAKSLLNGIQGLDDTSVINACKLVTFDIWRRNPVGAMMAKGYKEINPDKATIQNIQTMVKRSIAFFDKYGPVVKSGFTFEPMQEDEKAYEKMIETGKGTYGGYTATVSRGDGDFLTADTLWDFKVSKSKTTGKQTLQLLMYWIMGKHSGQEVYKNITKIGIFNPRLNIVCLYDMKNVSEEIIKIVEDEIIGYAKT